MNLPQLLQHAVLNLTPLDPGYPDHASEVWKAETVNGPMILRRSRHEVVPDVDFWQGAWHLFGLQAHLLEGLESTLQQLLKVVPGKVPQVLGHTEVDEKTHLVLECLPGTTCPSFVQAPAEVLEGLGRLLGKIHQHTFDGWGLPASPHLPLDTFHGALLETMQMLSDRFHPGPEFREALQEALPELLNLPVTEASLVMLDQDPSQYLMQGQQLTGLVDVEAMVVAPRALDLIGLEYVLDAGSAVHFKRGYQQVLPLPDLAKVRKPYRLFCRLLSIQGQVELQRWLDHPAVLD